MFSPIVCVGLKSYTMHVLVKYVVAISLVCSFRKGEAAVFPSDFEEELDDYVTRVMDCHHVPGLTLSVVWNNEIWARGYGDANVTSGQKVDNRTLFVIGSVTKAFTAALLAMQLNGSR